MPQKLFTSIFIQLPYYFIHHSEGADCYDFDTCAEQLRGIQDYHMFTNGWSDIGYSFLVGGDGELYEGRGWNAEGAHTLGFNTVGYGTCFIGDFMEKPPEPDSINTVLTHIGVREFLFLVNVMYHSHLFCISFFSVPRPWGRFRTLIASSATGRPPTLTALETCSTRPSRPGQTG